MKIWLVTHQFLPEFYAGTETVTFVTARELGRRGHDVKILAGHPGLSEYSGAVKLEQYEYQGLKVFRFVPDFALPAPDALAPANYWHAGVVTALRELLAREEKPDIAHVLHFAYLGVGVFEVFKEHSIPAVFTATDFFAICPLSHLRYPDGTQCQGPREDLGNCLRHYLQHGLSADLLPLLAQINDEDLGNLGWLATSELPLSVSKYINPAFAGQDWFRDLAFSLLHRKKVMEEALGDLNTLIMPSKVTWEAFSTNGLPQSKLHLLPFGLELENWPKPSGRMLGSQPELKLVFIGQITEHKGLKVLIEAVKRLPAEMLLRLTVYGNLAADKDYAKIILELSQGDPRISFAGSFPPEELASIVAQYDLIVVPSLWSENTPLVLLTSQEMGCPAIVSQEPGLCEIVDYGINGLTFTTGNADELATCLALVARDRDLLKKMAANTAKVLSIKKHADSLEAVYLGVLPVCPT